MALWIGNSSPSVNDHYLAVANYYDGSGYNVDSKIYKWNGTDFTEFQSLSTSAAQDWEFFIIGSSEYLVVANYYNGSTFSLNSTVYTWNGSSFVEYQYIPTNGAYDWEFFNFNGYDYLVVANTKNGL